MQYSVWPKTKKRNSDSAAAFSSAGRLSARCDGRGADEGDVELDFRLQLQTDPHLMPIENNGVLWPEELSPRVSVATLRLPKQRFDSPAQMEFAKSSPITRGIRSPSTARWVIKAGPAADVSRVHRQLRHNSERCAALRADGRRSVLT